MASARTFISARSASVRVSGRQIPTGQLSSRDKRSSGLQRSPRHDEIYHPVRPLRYENRLLLLALAVGLPGVAVTVALLWLGPWTSATQVVGAALVVAAWLAAAWFLRERVAYTLRTVANLLEALRREDFAIRARRGRARRRPRRRLPRAQRPRRDAEEPAPGRPRGDRAVAPGDGEIDVAVFAFDASGRLRLVNRAGELLLAQPARRLLGRPAAELGLGEALEGPANQTLEHPSRAAGGRWGVRRSIFREEGLPHRLLVSPTSRRAARGGAAGVAATDPRARPRAQQLARADQVDRDDAAAHPRAPAGPRRPRRGPGARPRRHRARAPRRCRASSTGYARLAQLPPPRLPSGWGSPARARAAALETRLRVTVVPGAGRPRGSRPRTSSSSSSSTSCATPPTPRSRPAAGCGWAGSASRRRLELWVEDEGPGLPAPANLFVPFFTTKPGGTGIGLALSRQIAEAHGGTLTLDNREEGPGCRALLRLPGPA